MRTLGVVPQKIVDEFLVEGSDIISEKRSVVVDEFFRERSVKPFNVAIHFGTAWIDVVALDGEARTRIVKVPCELASIVRLQGWYRGKLEILGKKVRS